MRFSAVLLALALAPRFLGAAEPFCLTEALRSIRASHTVTGVEQGDLSDLPAGAKAYLLGRGMNARVYRVLREDGTTYTLKRYDSPLSLTSDLALLHSFAAAQARGVALGFNIPRVTALSARDLALTYVPGESLWNLLRSPTVPQMLKAKLRISYAQHLAQLEAYLRTRPRSALHSLKPSEGTGALRGTVETPDGKQVPVLIKAENVIVNLETMEMTLVDPQ